jgi:hypothetical protein
VREGNRLGPTSALLESPNTNGDLEAKRITMKKTPEKKAAAKTTAKAAPAPIKDLQPKKDAKGGFRYPPPMRPPRP